MGKLGKYEEEKMITINKRQWEWDGKSDDISIFPLTKEEIKEKIAKIPIGAKVNILIKIKGVRCMEEPDIDINGLVDEKKYYIREKEIYAIEEIKISEFDFIQEKFKELSEKFDRVVEMLNKRLKWK